MHLGCGHRLIITERRISFLILFAKPPGSSVVGGYEWALTPAIPPLACPC
jgi:hypothetical protein